MAENRKKSSLGVNLALALAAFLLALAAGEIWARAYLVRVNPFYKSLPPYHYKVVHMPQYVENLWQNRLVVGGRKITRGDLWGLYQGEPLMGYEPKPNAKSLNGWWQSNNMGARSRTPTTKEIPAGMHRTLLFGDSFTNSSRVPQEETWPHYLNQKGAGAAEEFVNFGVDGYGMAQCLLRYESLRPKLDYDTVVLVFVPVTDLWRDINVLRQINGWINSPVVPRFVLRHGRAELVKSPYRSYDELRKENENGYSPRLKAHLTKYDRFYYPIMEASPFLISKLVLYRALVKRVVTDLDQRLRDDLMDPHSEAMNVSRAIIRRMDADAKADGKKFVLVYLPFTRDMAEYRAKALFRRRWEAMTAETAKEGIVQIDLMKDFVHLDHGRFDQGYDHSHFGPKSNKLLAETLWRHFKELGVLGAAAERSN